MRHIPTVIERAFRAATFGRPGVSYVDMPGDLLAEQTPASEVELGPKVTAPPICLPNKVSVTLTR